MSQLILSSHSSQFHRTIRSGSVIPLSLRVGKVFLFMSMTLMIGVISFFYLVKSTEIHTKGTELRKLSLDRERLITAQETKNTNIAQIKSLQSIRESEVALRMVPAGRMTYVKTDTNVAQRP